MNENLILNTIESKEYEIITYSARTLLWGKFVKGAEASCYLRWRQLTQRRPGNVSETIPDSTTRDDELRLHRPNRQRNVHHKCTGSPIFRTRRSRYSSWSQWWQRLLAVLAVFLWVGLCHGHIAQDINICQERYSGPADRICTSMDLRNNFSALDNLCRCRIIDGHLHFVLQEQSDNSSLERLSLYSFPGLKEITHHLLIYRVFNLTSLGRLFPNLALIRGDVLFHNYALVIYDVPNLQEVGLVSLSVILRGSVRIERNPKLCYVHTVDWSHITANRLAENYINRNRHESECPACPDELGCLRSRRCGAPRCWGPKDCQALCGSECPGGCVGEQCCHEECLGGCLSPGDPTTCHACRNLLEQGRCTHTCSSPKFKVSKHRCESREVCSASYAIKWDTQECVERCPTGYNQTILSWESRTVTQCIPCKGLVCEKHCPAVTVKSISHAQTLRGCTIIDGYLTIYINGGENIERELEENLSSIQEITGFLKIFRSNLTSLGFLSNLTRIGGEMLLYSNYSLIVLDNPSLQTLWNTANLTIDNGRVFVQSNPKLCRYHIEQLVNDANITGLSETDVSFTSNGDKVPCNVTILNASVSSSPLYGTLTVTVASTSLPPDTVYYVNYKKADKNISLYENEGPCRDQGWSTMEMGVGIATIVNLEPYTRYAVYVKTYSLVASAKVAQSDILYATTSPYNPTEPVHLEWTSPSSSSLEVWWEPPRRPNGVIDHYLVTLTLLPNTPRIPPDLDFCSQETRAYVDKNIVVMGADVEATVPVRTHTVKEAAPQKESAGVEDDDLCRAPSASSCCVCQKVGPGEDQEVMGQIGFEDFIMDNVYVKKINRSRRVTGWNLSIGDEELEVKFRGARQTSENTVLMNMTIRVPQEDSTILHQTGDDRLSGLLSGQQEENEELIFHQSKVEEFPFHQGQTENCVSQLLSAASTSCHPVSDLLVLQREHADSSQGGRASAHVSVGQELNLGSANFILSIRINRSRRVTGWNLSIGDEELEVKFRGARQTSENTVLMNMTIRVPQEDSTILHQTGDDRLSGLLSGQQEENEELIFHQSKVEEFPFHQGQTVHEFPIHAGIQADYQAHEEDLTQHDRNHGHISSLHLEFVRMTQEPRMSLHHLLHYSLYSVEVVACQAATRVPIVVQPGRISLVNKLCSSIPARVAAFTRANGVVDNVPEGSVRPEVQNTTARGSVVFTWDPPNNPNGGVVAYIFKILGRVHIERCVSNQVFEDQGRKVELHDLSPGNYSIWVRVRSKAMYGNFSNPVFFVIPDDTSSKEFGLGVISVVVAWVIVVAIVCWSWRRYNARYNIPDTVDKVDINPYYCEGFAPAEMFRQDLIFWRGDLKVFHDCPLGHGVFGKVFEGELSRDGQQTRVAVKTHSDTATNDQVRQFLKEAALMQNISCHHVVRLLGVVGDYTPVYVVMELMPLGDLKSFLKKHPPNFLTGQKMVEMAVEAADGMAYLAACRLVHRDLAARNCMLDRDLTLKIGDFGLSRNLKSNYYRKEGQGVLPVKWMSPESLQFSVYSTQSDVWSYGVLLWEMATRGLTPYKNRTNDEVIRLVVERYATLDRPRHCPRPLERVMRRCWRYEARQRPSFLSIVKFLLKHTSAEYQHRFEGLSFYHSRYSDYSRYHQTERSGFMSHAARESDDDLALITSSDHSEEDTPEEDIVSCRKTPYRSPKSGRTSPGSSERTSGKGKASFGKIADGVRVRLELSECGPLSGQCQDSVKKHLYTNLSTDDFCFNESLRVGGMSQGIGSQEGAAQSLLPTSNDIRKFNYSHLHLVTPSPLRNDNCMPSSFSLKPACSPQQQKIHLHNRCPSPVSLRLSRSLSSLTHTLLGSNQKPKNTSQSRTKFRPSPKLLIPVYSNLQSDFSTSKVHRIRKLSVTAPDECPRFDIPSFFSEDTKRNHPSTTIKDPSITYNRQQHHNGFPESSLTSLPTSLTRHLVKLDASEATLRNQPQTLDPHTSSCYSPDLQTSSRHTPDPHTSSRHTPDPHTSSRRTPDPLTSSRQALPKPEILEPDSSRHPDSI
ncbi:insulin-like peptide receptor [Procambarus clarkii]|uniref:insulin-like peptide receptor n=1 Tax=Procambarus clarkii TaxID=6728 RepID=UPI0037420312